MKKFLLVLLAIALFVAACGGGKKPQPQPFPQPSPVITPEPDATPVSIPAPTPVPTPTVDVASYLPPIQQGQTVVVSGENLSEKIQAAENDPSVGTVQIVGGGPISKQVTLKRHTVFDSSTYACDAPEVYAGCILVADGVLVEGTYRVPQELLNYFKSGNGRNPNDSYLTAVQSLSPEQLAGSGTTILEPAFVIDGAPIPAVTVFQSLADTAASHTGKAKNIAITGFRIKGRQQVYDGGVRSSVLLGNCNHCRVSDVFLQDTASIGITAGGSALEEGGNKDNFANDVVIFHNITTGVAAANIAAINSENVHVFENYITKLAHNEPRFGGGACGFDLETNNGADHAKNVWVYNNLFDLEGSYIGGNGVCLQVPFSGPNQGKVGAWNNVIIGGRNDILFRYLINGFFLNGLRDFEVVNNYVFRTGQNAIQAYAISGGLIQDNDFEATGGSGNSTIWTLAAVNNTFRRNHYRDRAGLAINTQSGFTEKCGSGNTYDTNLTNGQNIPNVIKLGCD